MIMLRFALLLIAFALVAPMGAVAAPNTIAAAQTTSVCAQPERGQCCPDTQCPAMAVTCCAVLPTTPVMTEVFFSPTRVAPNGTVTQMTGIGLSPAIPPPRRSPETKFQSNIIDRFDPVG